MADEGDGRERPEGDGAAEATTPPVEPLAAPPPAAPGDVPAEPVPAAAGQAPPPPPPARPAFTAERPEEEFEAPRGALLAQSRRDFLLFGLGVIAAASGAWVVLPDRARSRLLPAAAHDALDTLAARAGLDAHGRKRLLDRALDFDDDVAEALYSPDRRVRTYARSQVTPLRNNYDGRTPGPEILEGWSLELGGLASGAPVRLTRDELLARFPFREQVTRLVCVEGWSAVAWWGGIRFADLLSAYPPAPGARWAALRSDVNLDHAGRPDPYFVSIDLRTAHHAQTLLATHHDGRPLTLAHGAPLRLLVPVKLGLKNIKAITSITYSAAEPPDYWNLRGYSKYDGL
jgi:DMSO/TMAO reductase YedYZ molybdopterin-dependent catalytic subunit